MTHKWSKVLGLVLVAAVMLVGVTAAFAQEPADSASGATTATPRGFGHRGLHAGDAGIIDRDGVRADVADAVRAAVADALGLTVDELEAARAEGQSLEALAAAQGVDMADVAAAVATAQAESLETAVANGTITQAQADEMLARIALRQTMRRVFDRDARQAVVADALGITVEELEAARAEGASLEALAAAQGVDVADVHAAVEAAKADAVAQAVADGLLTQEQADLLQHGRAQNGMGGPHGGGRLDGAPFGSAAPAGPGGSAATSGA